MNLNVKIAATAKIIILSITLVFLFWGCGSSQVKNKELKKMNYQDAKDFIAAYAKYQKIPFSDVLKVNTETSLRGNVYNIEFDYESKTRVLIARGYIFHSTRNSLREDIWKKFLKIQNSPNSNETVVILPEAKLNFSNKVFELDTTIREMEPEYFFRLNLRVDFVNSSLSKEEFLKEIKSLADEALLWDKSYYSKVVDACNKEFFPRRAEAYIRSYGKSVKMYNILINKTEAGFSSNINNILFEFSNSGSLVIKKEIQVVKNITTDINFYSIKIKNDSTWYWRSSLSNTDNKLVLMIKIGDYSQSENEVIKIITHCIDSVDAWRKEL